MINNKYIDKPLTTKEEVLLRLCLYLCHKKNERGTEYPKKENREITNKQEKRFSI